MPSLTTLMRRRAVGPAPARDGPAGRPCSPLQDAGEGQGDGVLVQPLAHALGQPVEQRDRERPPLHDKDRADIVLALGFAGVAQGQHARVDEQAAVAVFGKARQAVDVGHLDAGRLQRLDQRVGQPLRELVQRHEPARGVVRGHAPDGASSRRGGRRQAPGATARCAPEVAQQLGEDGGRRRLRHSAASAAR